MTSASDDILARMMTLHPKIIDLTLDRVWRLLGALGNPQNALPPVIHIAGTNGKRRLAASPVIGNGRLYVIDTSAVVHAFDAQTGRFVEMSPQQGGAGKAPASAIEYLKKNPGQAEAFNAKYGYLPEGF